jgi:hypothetical protein
MASSRSTKNQIPGEVNSVTVPTDSSPEIDVGVSGMGRETLADFQDDLRAAPWPRAPFVTVGYDDIPLDDGKPQPPPIPNKGKARHKHPPVFVPPPRQTPPSSGKARTVPVQTLEQNLGSAPEIEVGETVPGRETLMLIDEELGRSPMRGKALGSAKAKTQCNVLELRTFVVPRAALSPKASEAEKRAFVAGRLSKKLPCLVEEIRRIDAKTFEPGAVLLRVWCPVPDNED